MAITLVGFTPAGSDNVTSASISLPAGVLDGDVLLLFIANDGTTDWTVPAGFTLVEGGPSGGSHRDNLYVKVAAGEPASYSLTRANGERSYFVLAAYREVDNITPIESSARIVNPTQDTAMQVPAITTTTADQMVVAFMGTESGNNGSALGAVWPGSWVLQDDNGNGPPGGGDGSSAGGFADQVVASPGTVPEQTLTYGGGATHGTVIVVALTAGAPPVIGVTTRNQNVNYGNSQVIQGFGFGVQGPGSTVELWSDPVGTIQVAQTVTAWSDTEITYTVTQGALSDDTTVYLVVTNDSSDETIPYATDVGLKAYKQIISDQAPDHWWTLDNTYDDDGGFGTSSPLTSIAQGDGGVLEAVPICEDATHCWRVTDDRRECVNSAAINQATLTNRLMGGWIMPAEYYSALSCIYEEGGSLNNICILMGLGNRLIASYADTGDDNVQAFSDFPLDPDRAYHIMFRFSHTDTVKEFRLYIDGQLQAETSGNPLTSGDLDSHSGDISFGGAGSNLEVGGTDVLFAPLTDARYANWVTWSESKPESDIVELFQRGALPDVTIASDTAANMQIALDALASTLRPNAALALRIQGPTDGNDLSLDADNITFDDRITIELEWRGVGALTWTNLNGSSLGSDKLLPSKGGSITVINPSTLTLNNLVADSEVRIYEAGTSNEIAGIESSGTTFSTTIQVPAVDITIFKEDRIPVYLSNQDTSADLSLPIQQRVDRFYQNL